MTTLRSLAGSLSRLIGFEGVLLGLFLAVPHVPAVLELLGPYRALLVGLVFLAAFGIGWRFGRGRIVHALVVLIAVVALPLLPDDSLAALLAAVLVPIDLALLGLLPDRGPFSRSGQTRLAVLAGQGIAVLVLATTSPPIGVPAGLPLPPTALVLLAFAAAFAVLSVRAAAENGAPARGLFWAVAAVFAVQLDVAGGLWWLLAAGAGSLAVAGIEDAHALAFRDPLTGLPSRRALDEALQRISGRYTLAMVDVDRFKLINDRFGHDVGDQVLRMVAKRLRRTGGGARAFRYGGEEFALLFSGKTLIEARPWLESARRNVEQSQFILRDPRRSSRMPSSTRDRAGPRKRLKVTVSIGGADRASGPRPPEVTKAADSALYRAKQTGRNRVMVA